MPLPIYPSNSQLSSDDNSHQGTEENDSRERATILGESPLVRWQSLLRESITSIDELEAFLCMQCNDATLIEAEISRNFPLLIPKRLAAKMATLSPKDPLFRQFVSTHARRDEAMATCTDAESYAHPLFSSAPLQEERFQKSAKLLKKYSGRALLITTGACAMHCRYCFRQNYAYTSSAAAPSSPRSEVSSRYEANDHQLSGFEEELSIIEKDLSLSEIILSGGDPLSLPNGRLAPLVRSLSQIPHISRLRWHTRFPIGIPERIDQGLLEIIDTSTLQMVWVLHINHPIEIDPDVALAIKKLRQRGCPILVQAVLMRGVNDSIETLHRLSEKLSNLGALFYYLHQLDPIRGSEALYVSPAKGRALVETLRTLTSGYGVPTYVQEIPGANSKTPL